MTVAQILAWVQAGQVLVNASAMTVAAVRAWIAQQNPAMTDADLNALCAAIIAGATAHKALADADLAAALAPVAAKK